MTKSLMRYDWARGVMSNDVEDRFIRIMKERERVGG